MLKGRRMDRRWSEEGEGEQPHIDWGQKPKQARKFQPVDQKKKMALISILINHYASHVSSNVP